MIVLQTMLKSNEEIRILYYLSEKMEANVAMISEHIHRNKSMTALVLRELHKKGLVLRLPELKAWRISKDGRYAINK